MPTLINVITIVSQSSRLKYSDFIPFEQKVQSALSRGVGNLNKELYCNIGIEGNLPEHLENQFAKVKNNIFVGFNDNVLDDSTRRAIIFELMAIQDDKIASINRVVVLISGKPITQSEDSVNKIKYAPTENEDQIPSYEASLPRYDFEKVILDDATKNQLLRSLALIKNQKLIFDTWGFNEIDPNTKTILCFFGAPGTGKTMCAHALAKQLGKKILIASYASIESKWVGEGPKNMRKIFENAARQDSILFFDEADSFLSKRVNNAETGSDKHYNRMSNEMFQLLEVFDGVVIFATNLVTDFDKAFKSRILSFVEFTLPEYPTRKRLIQSMIPSKLPLVTPLGEYELNALANSSDGFSGREIRKALLTSLSEAALNSKSALSIDDLLFGFIAVQTERKAVEETAARERNIISDYIEFSDQNKHIIDICQWCLNQFDTLTESSKGTLYKICKLLNLEMPDLSVSYKHKDLDSACQSILDANRVNEVLRYIVYLLGHLKVTSKESNYIFNILCKKLQCKNTALYIQYLESYKSII